MSVFPCEICSRDFSTSSNRSRHKRIQHAMKDSSSDEEESQHSDKTLEADVSSSETESESDHWGHIIGKACENVSFDHDITTPEQVLKEPYLSEMVGEIGMVVEERMKFANDMENKDKTYEQINNRIERYESDDMPRDEAVQTAWHDRRFLIRKMLMENLDIIKEKLILGERDGYVEGDGKDSEKTDDDSDKTDDDNEGDI